MTGTIHDATGPRGCTMGRLDTVKHQLGIEKE
jgi:hypothetical protein